MSDSKTETEKVVRDLEENMKGMPENLRLFSVSMRLLYSDQNPGTSTDISRKFTKLRDDTRKDAKIYLKVMLPLTTKLVSAIKDFFEYYDALSYEEWCDWLPDILENIKANKDFAETLLKMYREIIAFLRKREDEAKIIMTEFKSRKMEYESAATELQAKARRKRFWAFVLAFIPGLNLIAAPLLLLYANEDSAKAIAMIQDLKVQEAAALIVAKNLTPALGNFIKGLNNAAGFFKAIEIVINSFDGKRKEINVSHYKIMKNKVQKINPPCNDFYKALPDIRTDFEAIPDGEGQQNHVEKWLQEKLKEIQQKRESTRKQFWDIFKGVQRADSKATMPSFSIVPVEMSSDEQA